MTYEIGDDEKELMLRLMDRAEEHDEGWSNHWWRQLKSLRRKLYALEEEKANLHV